MDHNACVLIIDDEPDIRQLVEITLSRMGLQTLSADSVSSALSALSSQSVQLCLTDMKLPDGDGLQIVRWLQANQPHTPVAMITAFGSMDTAITALKAGAFDFVSKPLDINRLRELVQQALRLSQPADALHTASLSQVNDSMLGESLPMLQLKKKIRKVARSQAPVFINGESGTGKELVASMIHALGPRVDAPFIPVNCGAIPTELMESEFFGHKKGSFTGATEDKQGFFQAANGGTLFLDEVADLPINMQVKLLRAIQEKKVRAVGSEKENLVDIRILSASHKNLQDEVGANNFRQDLYYRINVIELPVPPLRERQDDIPLLANFFLKRIAQQYELPAATLSDAAMDKLLNHSFPGNVRELENILERAFTLCDNDVIGEQDLHLPEDFEDDKIIANSGSFQWSSGKNLEDFLESIEKDAINQALEETKWNKTAAAKRLGITFRALRYRLKKLGID